MPGPGPHYASVVKAGLAYLFLPVTGLVAYLTGADPRTRFHGLQAIVVGLLWPVALYVAALGPPALVQFVFVAGALVWLVFLSATLAGRNPRIPGAFRALERVAATSIRDAPRSTSGS